MSINLALESALSGLLTSQKALDVVSNNVANLNTPGYSRKVLVQADNVVNGVGAGVIAQSVQRTVDENLNKSLNTENGTLSDLTTLDQFYTQTQNLFGSPGDGSSISSLMQGMADAVQSLQATPNQPPTSVANAASLVTNSLQSMSGNIQSLRAAADQQIGQAVSAVNTALTNIAQLNTQIGTNGVAGISTDDLKDQRDAQLKTLAGYMNFVSFDRPDGTISIYTPQGTPLLDSQPKDVVHNSASAIQPRMTFDAASGTGALQGVMANGTDISSQITSGSLSALLQVRDNVLTNLQSQVDTLAQSLQTTLNQVNNRGTSWPTGDQSFTGSRTFIDPAQQSLSLSGGDTSVVLLNGDGTEKARTTVSTIMQQYLQSNKIPTTNSYTVSQLASGMNGWLNQQYATSGITYAQVTEAGQFSIQLPQTSSTSIAFRDQKTQSFESGILSDNLTSANGGKALNLTGPLTFRDSAGNVFSTTVAASDSLQDIANKINGLGGLTASLVAANGTTQPQLYQLQVSNNAGNDMTLDLDSPTSGSTVVSGLGINPSRSQAASDVAVNFNSDNSGTSFSSNSYPAASSIPGINGQLTFRDSSGVLASVNVTATDTLSRIAQKINTAANRSLSAAVATVGNQTQLVVTDLAGNQMTVDGAAGNYQSPPTANFTAAGAATLTVSVGGATYTVGGANGVGNDSLSTIADLVNADPTMAKAGITAAVGTDGTNSWLNLSNAAGQPMTFGGSVIGNGVGQFQINLNARDALGLTPPPDQTVSGFANFLGLNDLLVTGQNVTTFESQTLTNNFTTTTPGNLDLSDGTWVGGDPVTNAPQSLNINIATGSTLASIAKQINAQAVTYDTTHLETGSFKAAAGNLTVGNGLIPIGTVAVNASDTLTTIAAKLNANAQMGAAGVRASVATDGTNQWLRVYDQQGIPLTLSGTATGSGAGQMSFSRNQMVTASVASDGSGQRLRVYNNDNQTMQVTGTLSAQTGMAAAAVGVSSSLQVRSDIQATPALMSVGAVQYDSGSNRFYVGSNDNSSLQAMAKAVSSPVNIPQAGGLGQGNYSLTQYAASIISNNSSLDSNNKTQMTYQQTLVNNLTTQQGAVSGVNLDEELSNLITYQQSYSAAAKVISTVQQLFSVLNSIVQ